MPVTPQPEPTYTRDQVNAAINAGVELVTSDPGIPLRDEVIDLINLVASAIGTMLDNPAATLDEAITENYTEPPATVRCWVS